MGDMASVVGPIEMGKALTDALGLKGVTGIVKLQINCEGGEIPTITVVRCVTVDQAGAVCMLLKEWNLKLCAEHPATERTLRADGSVGEERTPPIPSFHPREG